MICVKTLQIHINTRTGRSWRMEKTAAVFEEDELLTSELLSNHQKKVNVLV